MDGLKTAQVPLQHIGRMTILQRRRGHSNISGALHQRSHSAHVVRARMRPTLQGICTGPPLTESFTLADACKPALKFHIELLRVQHLGRLGCVDLHNSDGACSKG